MFEKLGKFEIKRLLGNGAMGEVYLGVDPAIGREVAIKTILPNAAQGAEAKERFAREARAAGVLNHPNLVTIYEFGEDQGVLYIAMEYVKGHDLEELLQDQSLTRSESLEILAQVCDGLNFAHRQHIVHRDIKPANVRVQRDGKRIHAKVMDFGVARVANSDMTGTGMVMGTVSYMAPEYIRSGKPDPRSDLFAVGVMLYESLSGRKPFAGDTTPTILYKIVNEPPDPIDITELQGISPAIKSVLERSLDKDPDKRYQTADDIAKALRAAKDPTWQGQVEEATALLQAAAAKGQTLPPGTATPAAHGAPTLQSVPAAVTVPVPSQPTRVMSTAPTKGGKGGLIAAAAVLLVGCGAGVVWWMSRGKNVEPQLVQNTNPPPSVKALGTDSAVAHPTPKGGESEKVEPLSKPAEPIKASPKNSIKTQAPPIQNPPPAKQVEVKAPDKFAPETLEKMQPHQRMAQSNITLSEAIQLSEKDPAKAIEGFKNAIASDPGHPNAYAWYLVVLYRQGRYAEFSQVLHQARRNGISVEQMQSNAQFRSVLREEQFNHRVPAWSE